MANQPAKRIVCMCASINSVNIFDIGMACVVASSKVLHALEGKATRVLLTERKINPNVSHTHIHLYADLSLLHFLRTFQLNAVLIYNCVVFRISNFIVRKRSENDGCKLHISFCYMNCQHNSKQFD